MNIYYKLNQKDAILLQQNT